MFGGRRPPARTHARTQQASLLQQPLRRWCPIATNPNHLLRKQLECQHVCTGAAAERGPRGRVHRRTPACLHKMHVGVTRMEKERRYEEAVEVLKLLLQASACNEPG